MPYKPKTKQTKRYSSPKIGYFYTSSAWRRLRALKLSINPMCEHCEIKDLMIPAYMVDHIRPITEGGEALNIVNLQSLCKHCHAVKTGKEVAKRK